MEPLSLRVAWWLSAAPLDAMAACLPCRVSCVPARGLPLTLLHRFIPFLSPLCILCIFCFRLFCICRCIPLLSLRPRRRLLHRGTCSAFGTPCCSNYYPPLRRRKLHQPWHSYSHLVSFMSALFACTVSKNICSTRFRSASLPVDMSFALCSLVL